MIKQCRGFPGGSVAKKSHANGGDMGSIPGSGRSPGEGNSNPPQYCCLGNPTDRRAWWATVHRVTKNWTSLKWLGIHIQQCRAGSPALHPVGNPWLFTYSSPSSRGHLHIHGFVIEGLNKLRVCNPVVFTIEKKSACKWTHAVQTHAIQGELYTILRIKIGESLDNIGLDEEFLESTFNRRNIWLIGSHQS